jgi:hypothetical protein
MATVFNAVYPQPKLSATVYAAPLEKIAPGITAIVDSQQLSPTQSWLDALESVLPSLTMTDAQRVLVTAQISDARAGIEPLVNSVFDVAKNNVFYTIVGVFILMKLLK